MDLERGFVKETDMNQYRMNGVPVLTKAPDGTLLCAWAASDHTCYEDSGDEIVALATSDDGGRSWSKPRPFFATPGRAHGDPNFLWADESTLLAFSSTLTGRYPENLGENKTYRRESRNGGETWGDMTEVKLPFKFVVGKQHNGLKLRDGTLVMGFAYETRAEHTGVHAPSEGAMHLSSGLLRSSDKGLTWDAGADLTIEEGMGLDEPAFAELPDGEIYMLLRTRESRLYQTRSRDGGISWEEPTPSALTSCSAPASLLLLQDGRLLVVWDNHPDHRWPLSAALSEDGGRTWSEPKVIDDPKARVAYPSAVQLDDGTIVVAYWKSYGNPVEPPWPPTNIAYARFSPSWLQE